MSAARGVVHPLFDALRATSFEVTVIRPIDLVLGIKVHESIISAVVSPMMPIEFVAIAQ
jgi:hypothetical protein